jgi:hypothetical protein
MALSSCSMRMASRVLSVLSIHMLLANFRYVVTDSSTAAVASAVHHAPLQTLCSAQRVLASQCFTAVSAQLPVVTLWRTASSTG